MYRDYPLPMHPQAHGASEAALCAGELGKYWEYHDKLFANQKALTPDDLKKYAVEAGLDAGKFNACFDAGKYKKAVDDILAEGQGYGVQGTPSIFINGRFVSGALPYEAFKELIDEELKKKGLTPPAPPAPEAPK